MAKELCPKTKDFGDGLIMVNSDYLMVQFEVSNRQSISYRMRKYNIRPVKIRSTNYYSLRKIQEALEQPFYKKKAF